MLLFDGKNTAKWRDSKAICMKSNLNLARFAKRAFWWNCHGIFIAHEFHKYGCFAKRPQRNCRAQPKMSGNGACSYCREKPHIHKKGDWPPKKTDAIFSIRVNTYSLKPCHSKDLSLIKATVSLALWRWLFIYCRIPYLTIASLMQSTM